MVSFFGRQHWTGQLIGHGGIPGYCIVDELMGKGTCIATISSAYDVGILLSSAKYLLRQGFTRRVIVKLYAM